MSDIKTNLTALMTRQTNCLDAEIINDAIITIEVKDKEIERLKEALKKALDGYDSCEDFFQEELELILELKELIK